VKLHLTYSSEKTTLAVQNEIVKVRPYQIIVWVSVSGTAFTTWDSRTPRLPAILDIGNNHNFALTEEHLSKWAGISRLGLKQLGRISESGHLVPLCSAGLWLHTDSGPFQLQADSGIAIFDGDWPRLPILGLRALTNSKLQTFIYGDTRRVLIRTPPPWYWPC
jgi:hypothetical protein